VKNRVHGIVDELFPGFLKEKNTGIVPFMEIITGWNRAQISSISHF